MQKPARFILNFFLTFALLAGSFIPARAASPFIPLAGSPSDPLEPPPQRISLWPGEFSQPAQDLHSSQAAESPASPAWQVPVPSTCAVYTSMNTTTYEFDLYAYTPQTGQYLPVFITPLDEVEPRFNHGCTRILYILAPPSPAKEDLYLVNPDSSGQLRLTQNQGNNWYAAWSRDGSKIAFTSDRDGQPEVYTMNADGTNVLRLTYSGGDQNHNYDGLPDWSPDGSKIAFVSNRTGGYRIYVANADGSNPVQLSTQAYSFDPKWSPDGKMILYDAGANIGGYAFQRLYSMNADGSNQQNINDSISGSNTIDVNAAGWSPDGKYIDFNLITWVFDSSRNGFYWTSAVSDFMAPTSSSAASLTPGSVDWYPSWETYDNQAPLLSLTPLPAISPSPVNLSWTIQDISQYKIATDIQYQDNGGPWQDLKTGTTDTSLSFDGYGGHTYAFRFETQDGFFNQSVWPAAPQLTTTVESQVPQSQMAALHPYSHGPAFNISWTAQDPGGSGIASFNLQARDVLTPDWTDVVTQTSLTQYTFTGTLGHTYCFRVQATDRAHNVEAWPTSASGSACTTLYQFAVGGSVYDASGVPLSGQNPDYSEAPFTSTASDANGNYSAYFSQSDPLHLDWSTPGYGALPAWTLPSTQNWLVDAYLPPADDVIQNGGFEASGSSLPGWTATGTTLPTLATGMGHSGAASALLGQTGMQIESSTLVGNAYIWTAIDSQGNVFAVYDGTDGYYYTYLPMHAAWSTPQKIYNGDPWLTQFVDIMADSTGKGYFFFYNYQTYQFYFTRLAPGGTFTAPEIVPGNVSYINESKVVIDSADQVHHFWVEQVGGNDVFKFNSLVAGTWSPAQVLETYTPGHHFEGMIAKSSSQGEAALFWTDGTITQYILKSGSQPWSTPAQFSDTTLSLFDFNFDHSGGINLLWFDFGSDLRYFQHGSSSGIWDPPLLVSGAPAAYFSALVGPDGSVHFLWLKTASGQSSLQLMTISEDGTIQSPITLVSSSDQYKLVSYVMGVGPNGDVHIVWRAAISGKFTLVYDRVTADGILLPPQIIPSKLGGGAVPSSLKIGADLSIHLTCYNAGNNLNPDNYIRLIPAAEGDSFLSQELQVPAATVHPGLSFLYQFSSSPASTSEFSVQITAADGKSTLFSTQESAPGWTHHWIDLSLWAGQMVTLTFSVHQAANSLPTFAYLDEVSVGATASDAWVQANLPAYALPGSQVTLPITFGNQGKVPASGSQLTLTLPAGVTFVSANFPPTAVSPNPTWNVGDLPAESGPITIWVTFQLDSSLPTFTSLTYTASLTASTELETANNSFSGVIYTSLPTYLPLLKR